MNSSTITPQLVRDLGQHCGFALTGIASASPSSDFPRYQEWVTEGFAGKMGYLTDQRADKRGDPASLLPSARSMICVGMLYNGPEPHSTEFTEPDLAWISRYAWGEDYHDVLRARLETLTSRLLEIQPFEYKICVDTAPLLERSYAREAGLGWVGKNTCLIHQEKGSWFFLGEILTSLPLPASGTLPDRCGTCSRCVEACPTEAIVERGNHYTVDSRLCISYFTIELRSAIPEEMRSQLGNHVFGCDICQDVCPWNRRAPIEAIADFAPRHFAPSLERLADLSEKDFREMFHGTPVSRARYGSFLRNVAIAMGNQKLPQFHAPLLRLAASTDPLVSEHAKWALAQLG